MTKPMLILAVILCSQLVSAEVFIRSYNGEVIIKTSNTCYTWPKNIKLDSIPLNWQTFDQAAIAKSWPTVNQTVEDYILKCGTPCYVEAHYTNPDTRKVFDLYSFPIDRVELGRVAVGSICGAKVANYSSTAKALEWREVRLPDLRTGVTVCRCQSN